MSIKFIHHVGRRAASIERCSGQVADCDGCELDVSDPVVIGVGHVEMIFVSGQRNTVRLPELSIGTKTIEGATTTGNYHRNYHHRR